MSGGSYDYICHQIEDLEQSIRHQDTDPRRASFAKLMKLIGKAMHDIEWVDSGDYGKGNEHQSIDAVFSFLQASPEVIKKAHAYDYFKNRIKEFLE